MHKEELAKGGKLHHVDLDIDPAWQTAKCCHRREEERGVGICHPLPSLSLLLVL